jgi:hypothetical protein
MWIDIGRGNSAFGKRAGELGFRDFPGLPVMKENRIVNHRTLPIYPTRFLDGLMDRPAGTGSAAEVLKRCLIAASPRVIGVSPGHTVLVLPWHRILSERRTGFAAERTRWCAVGVRRSIAKAPTRCL